MRSVRIRVIDTSTGGFCTVTRRPHWREKRMAWRTMRIGFGPVTCPGKGVLVVFCDDGLKLGPATRTSLGAADRPGAARRRGRALHRQERQRARDRRAGRPQGRPAGGGGHRQAQGHQGRRTCSSSAGPPWAGAVGVGEATIVAEYPTGAMDADTVADLALGARLRAYAFDRYKTKRKEGEEKPAAVKVTFAVGRARRRPARLGGARGGRRRRRARPRPRQRAGQRSVSGRIRRAAPLALRKLGVEVEVLDVRGDEEARHGRAARRRRRARRTTAAARGHALERRQAQGRSRSPSSARACASTPAASRSSRPPAWRT